MTNFTLTVSGQLNGIQHRNIAENIAVDYSKLFERTGGLDSGGRPEIVPIHDFPKNQADLAQCANNDGMGIQGNLGLAYTVALGLGAFRNQDAVVAPGYAGGGPSISTNVFGSTIDFTITGGLNVGPNWTLTHFKGPTGGGGGGSSSGGGGSGSSSGGGSSGGANQGLIAGSRTAKDTLLISFAPACRQPDFPPPSEKAPSWEAKLAICGKSTPTPPDLSTVLTQLNDTLRSLQAELHRKPYIPAVPPPPAPSPPAAAVPSVGPTDAQRADALKGATTNNTQMLLQNIIPSLGPQ
jgi:hypothetical protein